MHTAESASAPARRFSLKRRRGYSRLSWRLVRLCFATGLVCGCTLLWPDMVNRAVASSPPPALPGADVPWTTYEAEDAAVSQATVLGPHYSPNLVTTEASGRRVARLVGAGQYVEFVAAAPANAIVIRYSVPDTADGVGADYTLSLYRNGVFVRKLPLTSKYSWLYGGYPFSNTPGAGLPRNFFDEIRQAGLNINAGDMIRLVKDPGDTASYYNLDLVDLERVAPPLGAPPNSLSIAAYGAVPDGVTDCTEALKNCLSDARAEGKTVWLPPGTFLITTTIDLLTGARLQGAGMWHTKLIGSAALYNLNPTSRLCLRGAGSNVHLADFAISGFLNYRNDAESNDGLGGAFGTGSTIERLWVEHTKAGAWLYNSDGLVVDGCRFRNTIADGINLNRGVRGTIVTNCTARGTGDDAFAIWPSAGTQGFAPGLNIIARCTASVPFLANGGAIYGGHANRIEDCRFEDIPYGCGILLSTTFPVGTNTFTGSTVVQRSALIRCGGYDHSYGWRAAVQICLDNYPGGLPGLILQDVTITNSVSDGLSIIGSAGALANALAANVTIPNCGLGASGRNALWARQDAIGSMTVSNSAIMQHRDDSPRFAFNFVSPPPPRILNFAAAQGSLALTYATLPGYSYRVQSSADLAPGSWTEVTGSATNAAGTSVMFAVPIPPGEGPRFYRATAP